MFPAYLWYLLVAVAAVGASVAAADRSLLAAVCLFVYGGLAALRVSVEPVRDAMRDRPAVTAVVQLGLLVVAFAAVSR